MIKIEGKKYIAFYISSHGFGHLTRTLSIIEHMLYTTDYHIYVCTDHKQIDFAKVYLDGFKNKVIYSIQKTDVGLINKENSLEVDVERTNTEVQKLLAGYDSAAERECANLLNLDVKLIVSDITALAFLVSKKLSVPSVGIANFTWIDQYEGLGLDKEIIDKLKELYSCGGKFIMYDLSLPFKGAPPNAKIHTDYLISRPIDEDRIKRIRNDIKTLYSAKSKSSKKPDILYISLGKSAELPQIELQNFNGAVIYTEGVSFKEDSESSGSNFFLKLPADIKDSQSYIAAADLVIAKAGWSTTAECLVSHSYLALIERPTVDDDSNTIDMLVNRKLSLSISENNLLKLDFAKLKKEAISCIDKEKLLSVKNDVQKVCDEILKSIN